MTYLTMAILILFVADIIARIVLYERREVPPREAPQNLVGVILIDLSFIIWAAYLLGEN